MRRDSSLIASLPPGNGQRHKYRASRDQRLVSVRMDPRVWLLLGDSVGSSEPEQGAT